MMCVVHILRVWKAKFVISNRGYLYVDLVVFTMSLPLVEDITAGS